MRENSDTYYPLKLSLSQHTNIQTAQGTSSMQTPLLESGHRRWAYSLSHSVYELLKCLLSAAKTEVLYEKVFIAAKSPAATRFIAPGQACPCPLLHQINETDWRTEATQSLTDCFRLMILMGWGHDGSLLLIMMGTDYDSDRRWSLHAVCSKTSRRKQYEQAEGGSFTAHLLSLDMICLMLYSTVLGTRRKKQPETWKSAMEQSFNYLFIPFILYIVFVLWNVL